MAHAHYQPDRKRAPVKISGTLNSYDVIRSRPRRCLRATYKFTCQRNFLLASARYPWLSFRIDIRSLVSFIFGGANFSPVPAGAGGSTRRLLFLSPGVNHGLLGSCNASSYSDGP